MNDEAAASDLLCVLTSFAKSYALLSLDLGLDLFAFYPIFLLPLRFGNGNFLSGNSKVE